ncbi:hypothetical protein [Aquimarina sp. RZ0]|uniref:hypothetical protein n=1 Tax=Aquimarina sp. RZ0 TaxID=2607730 RepID=UPI00165ED4C8|nr:hypothetical protein [Aquimarina sp. RZ0]
MKTQLITTKEKRKNNIHQLLTKWITMYINAMTKALYPDTATSKNKNDKNRFFHK